LEDPLEIQALTAEQDRLVHGVRLQEGLAELVGRLQDGADQAPSAVDHLVACCHELQQMVALDGSLQPLAERCLDLEGIWRPTALPWRAIRIGSMPCRIAWPC
jgi:DNA repair protein RecN (Recombination protein N)